MPKSIRAMWDIQKLNKRDENGALLLSQFALMTFLSLSLFCPIKISLYEKSVLSYHTKQYDFLERNVTPWGVCVKAVGLSLTHVIHRTDRAPSLLSISPTAH